MVKAIDWIFKSPVTAGFCQELVKFFSFAANVGDLEFSVVLRRLAFGDFEPLMDADGREWREERLGAVGGRFITRSGDGYF
ncbi:MAG: hypothetical protein R3C59_24340 [Planctomycetaceae bacterium]